MVNLMLTPTSLAASPLTAADGVRDARSIANGMILGGSLSAAVEFSDDAYGRAAAAEFKYRYVTLHGSSITIERFVKTGHPGTDADAVVATMSAAGGDTMVVLTSDVAFGKSIVWTNHYAGGFDTVLVAPQLYDPTHIGSLGDHEQIIGVQNLELPFGKAGLQRAYHFSKTVTEYSAVFDQNIQTNFRYVEGKSTAETLRAGVTPAIFKAGGGDDTLNGGSHADYLSGDTGNDSISGATGVDTLLGGLGRDRLYGGTDRDWLYGGAENDGISGQAGKDLLYGGSGNDRLFGGVDNDILNGGAGSDYLDGGANADRFVFLAGHGHDQVANFDLTEGDRLQISHSLWATTLTASQVVSRYAHIVAGEVVFEFGNGNSISLVGISSLTGLAAAIDLI